jgi:pre-mRNA-processing factor 19
MSSSAPKLEFVTLDVFTDTKYLGNPLAVVFVPADQRQHLTQEKKQAITCEFNLSETVFLHVPAKDADTVEIDIFCCECELPFAGHPTIGTAYLVLQHLKWTHVSTLLTKAGPIPITSLDGGAVRAAIPHAVHVHKNSLKDLSNDQASTFEPYLNGKASIRGAEKSGQVVSIVRGMTFVMIQLDEGLEDLKLVTDSRRGLDFGKVPGLLDEGEWAGGFVARYYYVLETPKPVKREDGKWEVKVRTRMAELASEDPATGSASSGLACKLALEWKLTEPLVMKNTQGVEMGRKSDIEVEVVPGVGADGEVEIKEVYLAGQATVVMQGTLAL